MKHRTSVYRLTVIAMLIIASAHLSALAEDRQVIFSDDFSTTPEGTLSDRWTAFSGNWYVKNGALQQDSPAYDHGIVVGDLYLTCDYRLEVDIRLVSGDAGVGFYWNVARAQTGENGNMLRCDGENVFMHGWMQGRYFAYDGRSPGTTLADKAMHHVRMDVNNSAGTFDLYWDGESVAAGMKMHYRSGHPGFQASMGHFEFDNVRITVAPGTDWNQPPTGRAAPEWTPSAAILPDGNFVYSIWNANRIEMVSPEGAFVRTFGEAGKDPGQLELPSAVATGTDGRVYVAEAGNNRVQIFDITGVSQGILSPSGAQAFKEPSGVALDAGSRVWVVDGGNNRLVCLDTDGRVLKTVGQAGSKPGQFRRPGHVSYIDGRLYVADTGNRRIQIFDPHTPDREPEIVSLKGEAEPCSVSLHRNGVYVVSTWRGLSTYNKEWKPLATYSGGIGGGFWTHRLNIDENGQWHRSKPSRAEIKAARIKHFIPAEKNLPESWFTRLREEAGPETYRGRDLDLIGMPIGGIGAGQLYLHGDGTLGCWRLYNRSPAIDMNQGFALLVDDGKGVTTRRLNRLDFPGAEFCGQYPVGTVKYPAGDGAIDVQMEAFTPFIPLNATDSGLPATIFSIRLRNVSQQPVRAGLAAWLENGVCRHTGNQLAAVRRSRVTRTKQGTFLEHTGEPWKPPADLQPRENVMVADFEGADYAGWQTTGTAFGDKPVPGRGASVRGKGVVDTYVPAQDGPQGTLTSPEFTITRSFLNFLIGGGGHRETCMNLLIDGKIVRSISGSNTEALAARSWDTTDFEGRKAQVEIVDRVSGGWGHIIVDNIEMTDSPVVTPIEELVDYGSMVLALADSSLGPDEAQKAMEGAKHLPVFSVADDTAYPMAERRQAGLVTSMPELAPGEERTVVFVMAWYFPNHANGHVYAARFADAGAVARYVVDNHDRLAADTRAWRDTYYDTSLPSWLANRLHASVSTLATDTCEWWKNGRFWAWEGVVCCHGTCTHVWNYEHAVERLFPELGQTMREVQDLGVGYYTNGLVGFRGEGAGYAADGQCGTVLKCYREHQMSADSAFLKRNWPHIKDALTFLIKQDGNDDGLIENAQHNTFDIEFYGPNTFVGALYLGALRAGEEMAREIGDVEFADRAGKIFESGSRLTMKRLWNGEYFIQDVDLEKHPGSQYGDGCLADQMFGQGWAHQVGLGYLYPVDKVRRALQSIWEYNWAPDTGPQNAMHPPERWFIRQRGEPGLFICTWPRSLHREGASVRYRNEVWSGIEYQVAGHMVWEDMLDEALSIVRAAHERYQPGRGRNPYNEVECGGHYARAMASWGIFTALSGFEYHGPKGHIGFAPRLDPEAFRAAFTSAEGWGRFEQQRESGIQRNRIELVRGRLRLKTLALSLPKGLKAKSVDAELAGQPIKMAHTRKDDRLLINFENEITVPAGEALEVTVQ